MFVVLSLAMGIGASVTLFAVVDGVLLRAPGRRVLTLVLGESALQVGVGLLLGLAGAMAAGQLLRGLLFGIGSGDPIALSMTGLVVLASGVLASALPAIRAARVEPGVALRAE